jgi:hypothetical protein
MYKALIVLFLLTISSAQSADISVKDYMDTGFDNIDSNITLLRSDILAVSEKIDKNTEELRKKNGEQDDKINENCTQLSSIDATLDIIIKILLGTGATGLVGGSVSGVMALQKRKRRNST